MRQALILLFVVGLTMCARPALAQRAVTPYVGYNYGGDSSNCLSLRNCEEKHTNIGISLGAAAGGSGFEQDIAYAKNFFGVSPGTNNSVLTLMSNLVLGVPLGPVHPFVVGGVGLMRSHATLSVGDLVTKNAFGYDLGGGIALSLGRHLGLRGDIRRFSTFQDLTLFVFTGGKLRFSRATIGITLK
jgi:opacity protein-like surface antigen